VLRLIRMPRRPGVTPAQVDVILDCYTEDGWSLVRIARHVGLAHSTVRRVLLGHGISLRRSGLIITDRQALMAQTFYEHYGWSLQRLADAIGGVNRETVAKALRRMGTQIRSQAGARVVRDGPGDYAARQLFADAMRPDRANEIGDAAMPTSQAPSGVTTYFRRRCQRCSRLSQYAERCPGCGFAFGGGPPKAERRDAEIADVIRDQTEYREAA
jgi:hypothetical protein